jgi:hypothetical protein
VGFCLEKTLGRLSADPEFKAEEIAVLACVPTEKWRFWAQRHLSETFLRLLHIDSDFVRSCDENGARNWQTWWNANIAPVGEALIKLRDELRVKTVLDSRFDEFRKITANRRFRILFLIAHHVGMRDEIEFRDGPHSWAEVEAGLDPGVGVVLIICESQGWQRDLLDRQDWRSPVGGGEFRFPVREASEFLLAWVREILRGGSLLVARDIAMGKFYRR